MPRLEARFLNKHYEIGAAHALYDVHGKWYHILQKFPGALFDAQGVVVFANESELRNCKAAKIGPDPNQLHIPKGISSLPGYKLLNPAPKTFS